MERADARFRFEFADCTAPPAAAMAQTRRYASKRRRRASIGVRPQRGGRARAAGTSPGAGDARRGGARTRTPVHQ